MVAKPKSRAIIAPDHLLVPLSAMLDAEPATRAARRDGMLILSNGAAPEEAESFVVIVPELERVVEWACRNQGVVNGAPLAVASRILARLASAASAGNVKVVEERELRAHPQRSLTLLTQGMGWLARIGKERFIAMLDFGPARHGTDMEPLKIYGSLPLKPGATAWWPYNLFSTPKGPCPPALNVMGRPRILCFGPYITLSTGTWHADVMFELSDDAAPYDYLVEFGTLGDFSRLRFRPAGGGQQNIALNYTTRANSAVEVRVGLLRAAFHGEMKLIGARVTRADSQSDDATPRQELILQS